MTNGSLAVAELIMQATCVEVGIGKVRIELQRKIVAGQSLLETIQLLKRHRAVEIEEGLFRPVLYPLGEHPNRFIAIAALAKDCSQVEVGVGEVRRDGDRCLVEDVQVPSCGFPEVCIYHCRFNLIDPVPVVALQGLVVDVLSAHHRKCQRQPN